MMEPNDVTTLLSRVVEGENTASGELFARVYQELRALANSHFRDQPSDHTLQPTALVNEAFVRLLQGETAPTKNRGHFFALASRVMRQILVDHARARQAEKRGGGWQRITLSAVDTPSPDEFVDVLALNEVLDKLETLGERKARLVEMRFFSGLSMDEIAEVLGVARSTLAEEWRFVRAWLYRELQGNVMP